MSDKRERKRVKLALLEWEEVAADTLRIEVPGGWLYRVGGSSTAQPVALCFVPDLNFYAPVGRLNHDRQN